jgi:hypothetical protein
MKLYLHPHYAFMARFSVKRTENSRGTNLPFIRISLVGEKKKNSCTIPMQYSENRSNVICK